MDIVTFLIYFGGGLLAALIVLGVGGTLALLADGASKDEISAIDRERLARQPTLIARG